MLFFTGMTSLKWGNGRHNGSRTELLLWLTHPKIACTSEHSSNTRFQKSDTPPYLHPPGLESPQSHRKQIFQPPLLFPSPKGPATSSGSPFSLLAHPWSVPFLWYWPRGWAALVLCLSSRRSPDAPWEFNPGRGLRGPSPGQPSPGWVFQKVHLLGSQGGNKSSGWSAWLNPVVSH